ncbi:MAG: hypothetical protein D3913_00630 [Candidatus Electrothrix sp. LOE1_4_5]|nr:hypothetical protein [Candidatus Electrothrix gigas]
MILSAHQPAYLPWLGYFDKIIRSDIFIFLDTVQYEKNSYINRNRIKIPQGSTWLTIPIRSKGHIQSTLLETKIDNSKNWSQKHLKNIYFNYKKAPHFDECYQKLESLYQHSYDSISELCYNHLLFWLKEFDINTKILRSSDLSLTSKKSELILDLCQLFHADHYISGALGKKYLIENDFQKKGIAIDYQNYRHPCYPQLHGEFLPAMSIVDFWMNTDNTALITGASS